MTLTYQPSAAGISWLALTQSIDQRMQMEQDLLELSKNSTKVQCDMTSATSTQTFNELTYQASGLEAAANASMSGAIVGGVVSLGTLAGALGTMPRSPSQTITNDIGIEGQTPKAITASNEIEMEEMSTSVPGKAVVSGTNTAPQSTNAPASTNTQAGAPSNSEAGGNTSPVRNQLNRYLTEHGTVLSQTFSQSINSAGQMTQADYTRKQAIAKSIEVAAQQIAQVMNQQQSMLSSSISSADTFANNTEGTFTTIIQVSAVRG